MDKETKEKVTIETEEIIDGNQRVKVLETVEIGEIIDMNQAVKLLETTRPTFYRWLRGGKIKGMKVGRQWRFYREDIERFLKGQEPKIDLPADIGPLMEKLRERVGQLGVKEIPLPDTAEPSPVAEAVHLMIILGVKLNASDIHLAPHLRKAGEDILGILRYRVDGVLHPEAEIDTRLMPPILEHWKGMAACDVLEKEKPQDGRMLLELHDTDRPLELRVSFLPTGLGESLTARIMPDLTSLGLDDIDFAPDDKEKILRWIHAPWGMIIVSGPTGSGKTTVLYACLNSIARPEIKVLTVEDPVEFFLPWAVQVQVRPDIGLTHSSALRHILRSDPDVIMVGEIRDSETLSLAQQCSLTGHLVISSMHVDESVRVLKRMVEMGGNPFFIGESTKLIIAQRLVRKLCPDCSVEKSPPERLMEKAAEIANAGGVDWDSLPKKFREPVGCEKCKGMGYRRRNVIAEALEVTPEIIAALDSGASIEEMRNIAVSQGMTTIAADGVRRAVMGVTSLSEVLRVLGLR